MPQRPLGDSPVRERPVPGRAPLGKRLERWLKSQGLPLARRLLGTSPGPARAGRVLVVRLDDRLGNLILLTPFLTRLRERRPEARISLLMGSVYAPLLGAWPFIDERLLQHKRAQVRAPWRYPLWVRGVRQEGWEIAYEMSNHNTHSFTNALLTLASGAERRVGFDDPRSREALTEPVAPPPSTRHFSLAPLELLRDGDGDPLPVPVPITCPLPADARCPDLTGGAPYVVVHVGGRGGKALPTESWRAIVSRVAGSVEARVVVIAGPAERDRVPELTGTARERIAVAPEMGVVELAALIRASVGYVGCDSGVMHLAVALGVPTVALFFRSNPYHYAPMGSEHATVLLANPYGVARDVWEAGDLGMSRSRLHEIPLDAEASGNGEPRSDVVAIDAVVDAVTRTVEPRARALI